MPLEFTVNGKRMDADMVRATAQKAMPKAKATADQVFHRGWAVEGYPPGMIRAAQEENEEALAAWGAKTEEQRRKETAGGKRAPKLWNLGGWITTHKPKKVRARPFEVASAAEECAVLARKSGWEYVRVSELKRGSEMAFGA